MDLSPGRSENLRFWFVVFIPCSPHTSVLSGENDSNVLASRKVLQEMCYEQLATSVVFQAGLKWGINLHNGFNYAVGSVEA